MSLHHMGKIASILFLLFLVLFCLGACLGVPSQVTIVDAPTKGKDDVAPPAAAETEPLTPVKKTPTRQVTPVQQRAPDTPDISAEPEDPSQLFIRRQPTLFPRPGDNNNRLNVVNPMPTILTARSYESQKIAEKYKYPAVLLAELPLPHLKNLKAQEINRIDVTTGESIAHWIVNLYLQKSFGSSEYEMITFINPTVKRLYGTVRTGNYYPGETLNYYWEVVYQGNNNRTWFTYFEHQPFTLQLEDTPGARALDPASFSLTEIKTLFPFEGMSQAFDTDAREVVLPFTGENPELWRVFLEWKNHGEEFYICDEARWRDDAFVMTRDPGETYTFSVESLNDYRWILLPGGSGREPLVYQPR